LITHRLFGRRAAILAGCLLALNGPFIFYNLQLLASGPALALNLLAFWLTLRAMERPSAGRWLWAGIAHGLAVVALPNAAVLVLVVLAWMLWRYGVRQRNLRRALAYSGIVVGCVAASIAPVAARNYAVSRQFVPIAFNGGYNLYLGNNPRAEETVAARPGFQSMKLMDLAKEAGAMPERAYDRWYVDQVRAYAREHTGDFLGGLARKARLFFNAKEVPHNEDPEMYRGFSWVLSALMWRVGSFGYPFGVVAPLALLGICAVGWRSTPGRMLIVFVLLYSASIIAFFITSRHRLPVAVMLIPFAAAGIEWTIAAVRNRRSVPLIAGAALVIAAGALVNWPVRAPTDGVNFRAELLWQLAGQAADAGDPVGAEHKYREALAAYDPQRDDHRPHRAEVHARLATVLNNLQRRSEAGAELRRALELDPHCPDANIFHAILISGSDPARALEHLRRAVESRPAYALSRYYLGDALLLRGEDEWIEHYRMAWRVDHWDRIPMPEPGLIVLQRNRAEPALRYYGRLLEQNPENDGTRLMVARALTHLAAGKRSPQAMGQLDEAIRLCAQTLERDANNTDAHEAIADAMYHAGTFDRAAAGYATALQVRPDDAKLHLGLGRCLAAMNEPQQAEEEFRRAIRHDRLLGEAHEALGLLLQAQGKTKDARRYLHRAQRIRKYPEPYRRRF
jgi:tetratricopeptide (TPR) repeat protein